MTIAAEQKAKRARLLAAGGRALAWWLGELREAWDDLVRRPGNIGRNAPTIEAGERYWVVRRSGRIAGQLDRAAAEPDSLLDLLPAAERRGAVLVEIPPERVLTKRVSLPAAARGELDRILAFEMARHFPFPAERVFLCHRLLGRRASGMLEIELIAVPREVVTEIRDELARAGLRAGAIAVAGEARVFLPRPALGEAGARFAPVDRVLVLAVVIFALAAIASPPVARHVRLVAVERELAALKPEAEAALQARARERRAADRTAVLRRLAASRPPLISVLAELTRAVPDGAWLIGLGVAGREATLDGLSPSAATTALALERSPAFSGVSFRSPITRDPATGLEHFQLGTTLRETAK